ETSKRLRSLTLGRDPSRSGEEDRASERAVDVQKGSGSEGRRPDLVTVEGPLRGEQRAAGLHEEPKPLEEIRSPWRAPGVDEGGDEGRYALRRAALGGGIAREREE